jgi:hypothetical protein
MLAEWRPRLCPFDSAMNMGVEYMSMFMPVQLPPAEQANGFKLWFDEVMNFYSACSNRIAWESVSLCSEQNDGRTDGGFA